MKGMDNINDRRVIRKMGIGFLPGLLNVLCRIPDP